MFDLVGVGLPPTKDTLMSITTELAIIGYFFAMILRIHCDTKTRGH